MKKIILLITLTLGALQAESIVYYDTKAKESSGISKPNYPNTESTVFYDTKTEDNSGISKPNHPNSDIY